MLSLAEAPRWLVTPGQHGGPVHACTTFLGEAVEAREMQKWPRELTILWLPDSVEVWLSPAGFPTGKAPGSGQGDGESTAGEPTDRE